VGPGAARQIDQLLEQEVGALQALRARSRQPSASSHSLGFDRIAVVVVGSKGLIG
jgi:elongation factor P--beta-lysine ligase